MYKRFIAFTKCPLKGVYIIDDKLKLSTIADINSPASPYQKHFPLYLDLYCEDDQHQNLRDSTSYYFSHETEALNLLSCISDFSFFTYTTDNQQWGVLAPPVPFEELSPDQVAILNNQQSYWQIGTYQYKGLKESLQIASISKKEDDILAPIEYDVVKYFFDNPIETIKPCLILPQRWDDAVRNFYSLKGELRERVSNAINLLSEGGCYMYP